MQSWNADDFAIAVARIECRYLVNKVLQREDQLLRGVKKIRHPGGDRAGALRRRLPGAQRLGLHKAWPGGPAHRPDADSALEPGNTHELLSATDRYAR